MTLPPPHLILGSARTIHAINDVSGEDRNNKLSAEIRISVIGRKCMELNCHVNHRPV